jgi:hypothetical protein
VAGQKKERETAHTSLSSRRRRNRKVPRNGKPNNGPVRFGDVRVSQQAKGVPRRLFATRTVEHPHAAHFDDQEVTSRVRVMMGRQAEGVEWARLSAGRLSGGRGAAAPPDGPADLSALP